MHRIKMNDSIPYRLDAVRWLALGVVVLSLSACAAAGMKKIGRVDEAGMPCTEATSTAGRALVRLGYMVKDVQPAEPGKPGRVGGRRTTGWNLREPADGDEFMTVIEVTCSDQGASFEALTNESWMTRTRLGKDFPPAMTTLVETRIQRPAIEGRRSQGVVITMEPLRPAEASRDLGVDVGAVGLSAVRVTIENRSGRGYGFKRSGVELLAQEGARRAPLSGRELTAKLPQAPALADKQIPERNIDPSAQITGVLFFPAAAYQRARVVLTDLETEETEGFAVEF